MKIMILLFLLSSCNLEDKTGDSDLKGSKPSLRKSCEELCSQSKVSFERQNTGFNFLSFTNFGHLGVGRCRGHALLTQKFSLLASYDENAQCYKSRQDCLSDYISGIEKIHNFKPHNFIGVKDLLEFSSIPEVKDALYLIVKRSSHKYSGGKAFIKDSSFTTSNLNHFYEAKRRVALKQLPYIGLAGKLTGKHAVLIYRTQTVNGHEVLCARDSNVLLEFSENCENYFFVDDAKVYYQRHGRDIDLITKFKLTKDEDLRVSRYIKNLMPLCLKRKLASGACK